jgi:anti-sigma regulatory factor (Ser/Thr protein kinase)
MMVRTVDSDWSHEADFAAAPISASQARQFVGRHLAAHGLQALVEDVGLVVSELSTNAVAHAQTPFTLTLSRTHGSVVIDIQDGSNSVPVKSTPDAMETSGRGLILVESLSQDWGSNTSSQGLKSVWASFPAPRQALV